MATYIKNDSLNNLNQSLQFMTQTANDIRAAKLREKQLSNVMGLNEEGWEAQNTFRKPDMDIKSLMTSPEAQKGQSLDSLNAIKELKSIYKMDDTDKKNRNSTDYQKQLAAMGLTDQSPKDLVNIYNDQQKQNAKITASNQKAESFNKANASVPKAFTGNEVDQQQQLLNETMRNIKSGGGIEAYNQYLTTHKAIDDHYQHNSRVKPPSDFGIGVGGKTGTKEEKRHETYIKDIDGNKLVPLKLTDKEINDPAIMEILYNKYKPILNRNGINSVANIKLQFGAGDSKDADLDSTMTKQYQKEKLQNAISHLNKDSFYFGSTGEGGQKIKNDEQALNYIRSLGHDAVKDASGKYTLRKGSGNSSGPGATSASDASSFVNGNKK